MERNKIPWLYRPAIISERIENQAEKVERMNAKAQKCTANYSGMPGGGTRSHDSRYDIVASLITEKEKLKRLNMAYVNAVHEFYSMVVPLTKDESDVLTYKHINGFGWRRISRVMHYSTGKVRRIYKRAIEHLMT